MADGNLARALDRADFEIDKLIERRAAANAGAAAERERVDRYLHHRDGDHLDEWLEHHQRQVRVFEDLAARHRAEVEKLTGCAGL